MIATAVRAVAAVKGAFDVSIVIHRPPSICRIRAIQASLPTSVNLITTDETRHARGSYLKIHRQKCWNFLQLSRESVHAASTIQTLGRHVTEHRVLRSRQRLRRPLDHSQLTIGQMCQCRGIKSEEISPPPHPGRALLGQRGKPILPNNRPHELWRSTRERISGEKPQYITIVREQPLLSADHQHVLAPGPKRSEPQVPVESRLIGSIDARCFDGILRLMAEGIRCPSLAVVGSLELNLIATTRHHRKQPVTVRDAERLQRRHRRCGKGNLRKKNPEHLNGGCIKDPDQNDTRYRQLDSLPVPERDARCTVSRHDGGSRRIRWSQLANPS